MARETLTDSGITAGQRVAGAGRTAAAQEAGRSANEKACNAPQFANMQYRLLLRIIPAPAGSVAVSGVSFWRLRLVWSDSAFSTRLCQFS